MTTKTMTGHVAIEYAEEHGLTLSKYNDPIEEAREGLTVEEALKVAREDPSLIYLTAGTETIKLAAAQYEDHDDCLAAAAAEYVEDHPEAEGWDLNARWQDDSRDVILLDAPVSL